MKRVENKNGSKIQVKQVKSANGRAPEVHRTLSALGLGRIGRQKTLTLNPALAGMVGTVSYLLEIRSVK